MNFEKKLFSAPARAHSERREKREGESLADLLRADSNSSYIAEEIFKRHGQNGQDLADRIFYGKELTPAQSALALQIREEIVKIKRDVAEVYEMMDNGEIMEEIAGIYPYFADIRKRIGLNRMGELIKFEDLVHMRLEDEPGFSQLQRDPLKDYQDATKNLSGSIENELKRIKEHYHVPERKIIELTKIPISNRIEMEEKIKKEVKSMLPGYIVDALLRPSAEKEILNVVRDIIHNNARLNVERREVAKKLREIITGNNIVNKRIEKNIGQMMPGSDKNPKKWLNFTEANSLFDKVGPQVKSEFFGEEAEDKIAQYWGEVFRAQKANELTGQYLNEGAIDTFWNNVNDADLARYQNECFENYKRKFVDSKLEPDKKESGWFDKIVNYISSVLGSINVDDVSNDCRRRMRRVK